MRLVTIKLTDKNFEKITTYKTILQEKSVGKVSFADALNNILENKK